MTVHLLKNRSGDEEYGRSDPYDQIGHSVQYVPIMDYEAVDVPELAALLRSEDEWHALVVTSPRAVDAVKALLHECPSQLFEKPVYTVGPATASRLEGLGFRHVFGADSGNGVALANSMVDDFDSPVRILFLAGEVHRRQLPDKLKAAGHDLQTQIVYRTSPNCDAIQQLASNIQDDDWVVFFSPSHTQPVLEFLRSTPLRIRIAVIGPTTRDFLQKENIEVHAEAPSPSATGLAEAINGSLLNQ